MRLKVKRMDDRAQIPGKAHNDDAGYDIATIEGYFLKPSETYMFRTGLKLQIDRDNDDFHNYYIQLKERSSLGKKGIGLRGGVLDFSYTGECLVLLTNHSDKAYQVLPGDRIAQAVIQRVESIPVYEAVELEETQRADKGFGSSGR